MSKEQEQWEKLVNLPDTYEANPDIAQRAIAELQQRQLEESQKQKRKLPWYKTALAVVASVAVIVGCGAVISHLINNVDTQPIVSSSSSNSSSEIITSPQIVYYDAKELAFQEITDLPAYVAEKGLNVCYFNDPQMTLDSRVATIAESEEYAFISQEGMYAVNFDKVLLWCVVKKNAEFNFYDSYQNLKDTYIINNITVQYQVWEKEMSGNRQVLAKFTYQENEYFLDITTYGDGVQQLELYMNMLLGQ